MYVRYPSAPILFVRHVVYDEWEPPRGPAFDDVGLSCCRTRYSRGSGFSLTTNTTNPSFQVERRLHIIYDARLFLALNFDRMLCAAAIG